MNGQPLAKSLESWPFCSHSEGLMRGSACAAIILGKPIDSILRGDSVLGILKSITLTNDAGLKPNFMSPSIEGQQLVIERAIKQSEVPISSIPFWECHAAGTTIGDSVELSALNRAFFKEENFKNEEKINPLFIGSCKANIGHSFAASGICSIIKILKMLETGLLPPQPLPQNNAKYADLLNSFNGRLIVHSGSEPKELLTSKTDVNKFIFKPQYSL